MSTILHDPVSNVSVRIEKDDYGTLVIKIKSAEDNPAISYNDIVLRSASVIKPSFPARKIHDPAEVRAGGSTSDEDIVTIVW